MQRVLVVLSLLGVLTAAQHRVNLNQIFDKDVGSRVNLMKTIGIEPLRLNSTVLGEMFRETGRDISVEGAVVHGLSTMQRAGDLEFWTTQGGELRMVYGFLFKNLTAVITGLRHGDDPEVSSRTELSDFSMTLHDGVYLSDNTCTRDVGVEFGDVSSAVMTLEDRDDVIDVSNMFNTHMQNKRYIEAINARLRRTGICANLGMQGGPETAVADRRRSNKFNMNPLTDRVLDVLNVIIKAKGLQYIPMGDVTDDDVKLKALKVGDMATLERRGDSWMRTMPDNVVQFRLGVGLAKFKAEVDDMKAEVEGEEESTGPLQAVMRGPTIMLQASIKFTDQVQFEELDIQIERVEQASLFRRGRGTDITELVNKQVAKLNRAFQGDLGAKINQALRDNNLHELDSAEIDKALEKYFASSEEK